MPFRRRAYDYMIDDGLDTRIPVYSDEVFNQGIHFCAKFVGNMDIPRPQNRLEIVSSMRRIRFEFREKGVKKQKVLIKVSTDGVYVYARRKPKFSVRWPGFKSPSSINTSTSAQFCSDILPTDSTSVAESSVMAADNDLHSVSSTGVLGMGVRDSSALNCIHKANLILYHPIYRIFYVSHDSQDLNIFSYIARDSKTSVFRCNVFKAYKKLQAMRIVRTIGQAFDVCHRLTMEKQAQENGTQPNDDIKSKHDQTEKKESTNRSKRHRKNRKDDGTVEHRSHKRRRHKTETNELMSTGSTERDDSEDGYERCSNGENLLDLLTDSNEVDTDLIEGDKIPNRIQRKKQTNKHSAKHGRKSRSNKSLPNSSHQMDSDAESNGSRSVSSKSGERSSGNRSLTSSTESVSPFSSLHSTKDRNNSTKILSSSMCKKWKVKNSFTVQDLVWMLRAGDVDKNVDDVSKKDIYNVLRCTQKFERPDICQSHSVDTNLADILTSDDDCLSRDPSNLYISHSLGDKNAAHTQLTNEATEEDGLIKSVPLQDECNNGISRPRNGENDHSNKPVHTANSESHRYNQLLLKLYNDGGVKINAQEYIKHLLRQNRDMRQWLNQVSDRLRRLELANANKDPLGDGNPDTKGLKANSYQVTNASWWQTDAEQMENIAKTAPDTQKYQLPRPTFSTKNPFRMPRSLSTFIEAGSGVNKNECTSQKEISSIPFSCTMTQLDNPLKYHGTTEVDALLEIAMRTSQAPTTMPDTENLLNSSSAMNDTYSSANGNHLGHPWGVSAFKGAVTGFHINGKETLQSSVNNVDETASYKT